MKNKLLKSLIGAAIALFFVCGLTFAKTSHIDLIYRGQIGNSSLTLPPGNYKVAVNKLSSSTPEMAFYQNGKLIGTAPVNVVIQARKNNQTEVFYSAPKDNLRHITQMNLSGWKDKLMFGKTKKAVE